MPVQSPLRPRRCPASGAAAAPGLGLVLGLLLLADAAVAATKPFQRPLPTFVGKPRKSRPPALDFTAQVVGGATAPVGRCARPGSARGAGDAVWLASGTQSHTMLWVRRLGSPGGPPRAGPAVP
jgi:hypothetical protein